ncbi:Chromobox protein-like protein 2, partial [Frankliniella fusca]
MRPVDVTPDRVLEVYKNLYYDMNNSMKKPKYKVGHSSCDAVPVYRLEDLDKDPIEGTFYEMELQKVTKPEAFKIACIVRSKRTKGKRQHLVHWRGYPKKSRSWIFDTLMELSGQDLDA